jgi:hypothetical protein
MSKVAWQKGIVPIAMKVLKLHMAVLNLKNVIIAILRIEVMPWRTPHAVIAIHTILMKIRSQQMNVSLAMRPVP